MPEGEVQQPKTINEATIIQFNLKWFIGSLLSLLLSFGGFYFGFVRADTKAIIEHVDDKLADERRFQELKFEKLDDMNTAIGDLKVTVDALKKRNDDLDALRTRIADNTDTSGEL